MSRTMTLEGYRRIKEEMETLWSVERPEIVRQVSAAAELGDRSENAAYIYGKRRLREIDSRSRYLKRKLENVTVVDLATQPSFDDVRFGACVRAVDDDGVEHVWRLVDMEESVPSEGRISVQSPIGRTVLGHRPGDYIVVELPRGKMGYEIVEVRYGADAEE